MFSDPQSVTINAVAQSMPRVSQKDRSAVYMKGDQSYTLSVSHTTAAKGHIRSLVRLDQRAVVTNPLDSTNDYDTMSFYVVLGSTQLWVYSGTSRTACSRLSGLANIWKRR